MTLVLDTETTGLVAATSRIIEIAIADFETGSVLFHSYIDPETHIPEIITGITGIDNSTVLHAPKWREVDSQVASIIQSADAIIGYNPSFDKGMISAEHARLTDTLDISWPQLIDPRRIWDVFEPREKRSLVNAYRRFVDKGGFEGAHGALKDTMATRDVLLAQVDHFGLRDETGAIIPWADMDPERKSWFGPTEHVLLKVDGHHTEGPRLLCNFGKNSGKPVHEIELGFWRWVMDRDFPDHVVLVAIKAIEFVGNPVALHSWAEEWVRSHP